MKKGLKTNENFIKSCISQWHSTTIYINIKNILLQYSYQQQYLTDAICQTLVTYLQDGVLFGIVYFDSTATELRPELLFISSDRDTSICHDLDDILRGASESTRSIQAAIETATAVSILLSYEECVFDI